MKVTPQLRAGTVLLGIFAGFALAVREGLRTEAHGQPPPGFTRLHQPLSPEAAFYPPRSMLENLALSRWRPGQTIVVIGGNSVLHGVGQSAASLWSLRLQDLLGEKYLVLNLAFRGAHPAEGGAIVAESLLKRGLPVLYVANSAVGPVARPYEGAYQYLFWDARARESLLPNPARTAELDLRLAHAPNRAELATQDFKARLDRRLHYSALWHDVGQRGFSTVWTEVTRGHFWWPRARFPDAEPDAPPLAQRYSGPLDLELVNTRGASATFAEPDGQGGWRLTPGPLHQAEIDLAEVFPAALRPRTLILLSQPSPYYLDQLTPDERARHRFAFAAYEEVWRRHGIACVTAGTDFTAADYLDRIHLSPTGGHKLAELVAQEILRLPSP